MENVEGLEDLKKPLPPEAVKPHPTKTYLSSIKAIYVTERFNDVFGVGKWTIKVDHIATQPKTEKSKAGDMVVIKTTFEVPELKIYYESYGGNDNLDLGDAYKGATTDAITKIGSYLGVGIDVFKGKVKTGSQQADNATTTSKSVPSTPTTPTQSNVDDKGWMEEQDFERLKGELKSGDAYPQVKALRDSGWKISKATAQLITDYIDNL